MPKTRKNKYLGGSDPIQVLSFNADDYTDPNITYLIRYDNERNFFLQILSQAT